MNYSALHLGVVTILILAVGSHAGAADRGVLVLNSAWEPPYSTPGGDGFLDVIVREAFRRAGVELRLVKLPAERGLANANAGIDDGDLARIAGLEKQYPDLVRVPEKLSDIQFTAFSKDSTIPANWPDIRRRHVGYIRGWKIFEKAMSGSAHVTATDDADQLFHLLSIGRIEVALYELAFGEALLAKMSIHDVHALMPPLATRDMFMYLNRRHADLVPKIVQAIRQLKREGVYDRVYREKILPYRTTSPR